MCASTLGRKRCPFYGVVGVRYSGVYNVLKSMEIRSGQSQVSVIISWVSTVEGYPLSGVPLYRGEWERLTEIGTDRDGEKVNTPAFRSETPAS